MLLFSVSMKFICGTCWIQAFLHAYVCVPPVLTSTNEQLNVHTQKRHTVQTAIEFAESLMSWLKRRMMLFPQCTSSQSLVMLTTTESARFVCFLSKSEVQ